jgi:hypothetical protein
VEETSGAHEQGPERESGVAPQEAADAQYAGTSLRLQVLEVIGSLLNSTAPELEEVRVRLRNLVVEHPWHPETALLRHVRDLNPPVTAPRKEDGPLPPAALPPPSP